MNYLEHKDVPVDLKDFWRQGKLSDNEFDIRAKDALRELNIACTDEEEEEARQAENTKVETYRACV